MPRSEDLDTGGASSDHQSFLLRGLVVFAVALLVRALHLWQISRLPEFELLLGDAQAYWTWGQEIAGGDWLGSTVFYQAPLYPYFLAVVQSVLGDDLLVVRLLQALLGATSCVLLAHATARLFSRATGVVAGLLLALYGSAIFFDGMIQKSVLDLFFITLIIWIIAGLVMRPRNVGWLWLGLVLGGLILTRENALTLVGAVVIWLLVDRERPPRTRAVSAAVVGLGLIIALAPVAIRNTAVGGGFHLTTSQLGPNLYIGNNDTADGTYRPLRARRGTPRFEQRDATELAEAALGRTLSPAEVSRYWTGRVTRFVRDHPGRWLALTLRKLALAVNATEIADTEDQYTWAAWSPPLRITGAILHFGVIAPLALGGIVLTWSRRRQLLPLLLMPAFYLVGLVVFYVFARYRLPLVPFLVLFAAAGLCAAWTGGRQGGMPWSYVAICAVAAVACNWPLFDRSALGAMTHCNFGIVFQDRDEPVLALEHLEIAVERAPTMDLAHQRIGVLRAQRGDLDGATAAFERALTLDPTFASARTGLGNIAFMTGDLDRARVQYEGALRDEPDHVDARYNLGAVLERLRDLPNAAASYERVLELDPEHADARRSLARVQGVIDTR